MPANIPDHEATLLRTDLRHLFPQTTAQTILRIDYSKLAISELGDAGEE
jgi:hypothetical protein